MNQEMIDFITQMLKEPAIRVIYGHDMYSHKVQKINPILFEYIKEAAKESDSQIETLINSQSIFSADSDLNFNTKKLDQAIQEHRIVFTPSSDLILNKSHYPVPNGHCLIACFFASNEIGCSIYWDKQVVQLRLNEKIATFDVNQVVHKDFFR